MHSNEKNSMQLAQGMDRLTRLACMALAEE